MDFILVLLQEGVFGVFVYDRFVFYVLGTGGVTEGREGLFVVVIGGGESGDHYCLLVTTERVLKETG